MQCCTQATEGVGAIVTTRDGADGILGEVAGRGMPEQLERVGGVAGAGILGCRTIGVIADAEVVEIRTVRSVFGDHSRRSQLATALER